MKYPIVYKKYGNKAVLMEWPLAIEEEILQDITRVKELLLIEVGEKIEDIIIGYNSLVLKYKKEEVHFSEEIQKLQALYQNTKYIISKECYVWEIPVCYDEEFGIDLGALSLKHNMPISEIIHLHTQPLYTLFFIGFLPGFMYLGGLDEKLISKRKATPRIRVAKGSVAIGGSQTGVYPVDSSGGWNIIGRTPIPFFDVNKTVPCFAKSGDKIQFTSVEMDEYRYIQELVEEGKYSLKRNLLNA